MKMNDLISRQDAIMAVKTGALSAATIYGRTDEGSTALYETVRAIKALPSAQPEQSSEIQDILEYLDTVLHPIISPDHWNVYSELYDMISVLPSAQPQLDTCPIYGGMCGYPSNLCYECPRHGGAKERPQWWTEGLQPFAQPQWIPVTERLPEYGTEVVTINKDDEYEINHVIDEEDGEWFFNGAVAWMPLPEPWKGEQE